MFFRQFSNVSHLSLPRISQVYSNFRNFHAVCNSVQDYLPVVFPNLMQRLSKRKETPLFTPSDRLKSTGSDPVVEKVNTASESPVTSRHWLKKRIRPLKKKSRVRRHVVEDKNLKKKIKKVPPKTNKSKSCVSIEDRHNVYTDSQESPKPEYCPKTEDPPKEKEPLTCPAPLPTKGKEVDTKTLESLVLKSLGSKTDQVKLQCPVKHPEMVEIDTKALEILIVKTLTSKKDPRKRKAQLKCPQQQSFVEQFEPRSPDRFQVQKIFRKKRILENEVEVKCLLVTPIDNDLPESIIPKDYFTKIDRPKTNKMEVTAGLCQVPVLAEGNKQSDQAKEINMEMKYQSGESKNLSEPLKSVDGYKSTDQPEESKAKIESLAPCPVAEMLTTESPKTPTSKDGVKEKDRPKESKMELKCPPTEIKDLFEAPTAGGNKQTDDPRTKTLPNVLMSEGGYKQTDQPEESKAKIGCLVPCPVAELLDKKSPQSPTSKDSVKQEDRSKESIMELTYPITAIKDLLEAPKLKGENKQTNQLSEIKKKIRCLVPCPIAELFDTKSPKSPTLKDSVQQKDQPNENNMKIKCPLAEIKNLSEAPMSKDDLIKTVRSKLEIKCKTEITKTKQDNKKGRGGNENNTKKN